VRDKEKQRVGWEVGRFIQSTYFVANWKGKTSSLLSTVKPLSPNRGPDGTITVWIKESSQPPQWSTTLPTLLLSPLYVSLDPREVMGKLAKWAKGEACESLSMKRLKSWRWSLCFLKQKFIQHSHYHYSKDRGHSEHDQKNGLYTSSHIHILLLFFLLQKHKYVMKDGNTLK